MQLSYYLLSSTDLNKKNNIGSTYTIEIEKNH